MKIEVHTISSKEPVTGVKLGFLEFDDVDNPNLITDIWFDSVESIEPWDFNIDLEEYICWKENYPNCHPKLCFRTTSEPLSLDQRWIYLNV